MLLCYLFRFLRSTIPSQTRLEYSVCHPHGSHQSYTGKQRHDNACILPYKVAANSETKKKQQQLHVQCEVYGSNVRKQSKSSIFIMLVPLGQEKYSDQISSWCLEFVSSYKVMVFTGRWRCHFYAQLVCMNYVLNHNVCLC